MINDNPKPNKVDMHGIQKKGIGGDFGKMIAFYLFLAFIVIILAFFKNFKQKNVIFISNNAQTINCKTITSPKI